MRLNWHFISVCLVGLIALSACVAPNATSPTVDTPSGTLQLIEFYSPL